MKRKPLSILAALMLALTIFIAPASASSDNPGAIPGLTGRVTGPAATFVIAPGSSFEATFDCLHELADARASSGSDCWPR